MMQSHWVTTTRLHHQAQILHAQRAEVEAGLFDYLYSRNKCIVVVCGVWAVFLHRT